MVSPSPIPDFFVEKLGSNKRVLSSLEIPEPLSAASSRIRFKIGSCETAKETKPSSLMAPMALSIRLIRACLICWRSRFNGGMTPAFIISNLMLGCPSRYNATVSSIIGGSSQGSGLALGKRAKEENSFTRFRIKST